MTRRQRTLLFFLVLGAFAFAAPAVAFYSNGYRIDWTHKRITQTGAFYIKAIPARAQISIDDEFEQSTSYFFGSAVIRNLLPGSYEVRVEREGFHPWTKTLPVAERFVTETKDILLFPREVAFQTLEEGIENLWIAPSGDRAAIVQRDNLKRPALSVLDLGTGKQALIWQGTRSGDEVFHARWDSSSTRLLAVPVSREQLLPFVVHPDSDDLCPIQNPCNIPNLQNPKTAFFPGAQNRLIGSQNGLRELEYLTQQNALISRNVLAFTVSGASISWLDFNGMLWRKDIGQADPVLVQDVPFPVQQETEYELIPHSTPLIKSGSDLYWFDSRVREWKLVHEHIQEVIPSPDGKKLALLNTSEIWLFYLEDDPDQPRREKGEKVFLTRFSGMPQNGAWITSHYFAFTLAEELRVTEIDTRGNLNVVTLGPASAAQQLSWNNEKQVLLLFQKGSLLSSEKLIR